jgi:hypothetical protein
MTAAGVRICSGSAGLSPQSRRRSTRARARAGSAASPWRHDGIPNIALECANPIRSQRWFCDRRAHDPEAPPHPSIERIIPWGSSFGARPAAKFIKECLGSGPMLR